MDVKGERVICGARNHKSKAVFKARKTSYNGQAGTKQSSLEKNEMVFIKVR